MIKTKLNRLSLGESREIKRVGGDLMRTLKDTQTVAHSDDNIPKGMRSTFFFRSPQPLVLSDLTQKVLRLIAKYRKDISEDDLPKVQAEMKAFFDNQPQMPYYCLMDRRYENNDNRLVIIGDTHCDFNSLSALFEKLSLSSYPYFDKATFIFLGDYLDRGNILFEYLMLLISFKKLLGDRCVFMKGNHELIAYQESTRQLQSMVYPADTCPTLNTYCGTDKEFLRKFADYFSNLPYYIILKTPKGTDLLVHGGVPRDSVMDKCYILPATGELQVKGDNRIRETALDNMIWADPRPDRFKLQGGGSRFEFGSEQFDRFASMNKIDRVFRSHEPVLNGVESFFNNRLFTVFSTGGTKNSVTGYPEVENPVFAIMGIDGEVRFESIYFKRVFVKRGYTNFDTLLYMGTEANNSSCTKLGDLHLDKEFYVVNQ